MEKLSLEGVIKGIEPKSKIWEEKAKKHALDLAIPKWSLGKILNLGVKICAIQRTLTPDVDKKMILTMAGDHGVAEEGVSAFPQLVTLEMVKNIVNGGAGVNILAKASGAEVVLVDMGVKADFPKLLEEGKIVDFKIAYGTNNFTKGPAMTKEQAIKALEKSIAFSDMVIKKRGVRLLGTGDLGIGNTTPSTAVLAVIGGYSPEEITGRGTGIDDKGLKRKINAVNKAIKINNPNPNDGLDVLAKVGGYDIAGIAGTILGASYNKIPVIIDGFISTAGALIAKKLCPDCVDYMIASHRSEEIGHKLMWQCLGLEPLLDLGFRLGEGTGAAVCMHLVQSAVSCMKDMLTFEEARVTNGLK